MSLLLALCLAVQAAERPYVIRVVDEATGRGVPLIELRTTSGVSLITDNAGVIAFDEPGLLGHRVYFFVEGHGYEGAADGFGIRGVAFDTTPGGSGSVKVRRLNIAERLYRITGQGLYHHSVRAGLPVPLKAPVYNAGVMGQDTAVAVVRDDKIRWFWGDTNLPGYAMGHFGTSTATAGLPGRGGLDPAVGIDLKYAVDEKGLCRPTFSAGQPGAVWVHGGFVLQDPQGRERILTQYERVKSVTERLEVGIAVFDEETERFSTLVKLELKEERHPFGQPFRMKEEGVDYVVFALPYPALRVKARWEDVLNPEAYEGFTCIEAGGVRRDAQGKPEYRWRRGALPWTPDRQETLVKQGLLKADEGWIQTRDADGGELIHLHRGSVRWNAFRKAWVMLATRRGGEESLLGDVYYAEAAKPEGPWPRAVKVVGHKAYTFYNPVHHDFFDQEGGRLIYFEGTYTMSFSQTKIPTPRYDYNQILYRLDLSDPRLSK